MMKITWLPGLFFLCVIGITSCDSVSVKYPVELKGSTVEGTLTFQVVDPTISSRDMPMAQLNKFRNEVIPVYTRLIKEADVKQLIIDKIRGTDLSELKNVKIVIDEKAAMQMTIPQTALTDEEFSENPYFSKFQFESVRKNIKTPYILDIKITKLEYYAYKKAYRTLTYATLYQVETGKLVWAKLIDYNESDSIFAALGRDKIVSKETAAKSLDPYVTNVVETIQEELK